MDIIEDYDLEKEYNIKKIYWNNLDLIFVICGICVLLVAAYNVTIPLVIPMGLIILYFVGDERYKRVKARNDTKVARVIDLNELHEFIRKEAVDFMDFMEERRKSMFNEYREKNPV